MPNLVYTISPYTPFTKILSANINKDKSDIQNRLNWSGTGGDVLSGLDGTNIQGTTAITAVNAAVTTQGVTLTANTGQGANGNSITITFTSGAVAGQEIVTVVGTAITVQVASGTSTVTQVVTAMSAAMSPSLNLVTASGSSSSTVSSAAAVSLTGGVTSGGLQRSSKLQLDTANYVLINGASGAVSSEAQLALSRGGLGTNFNAITKNTNDVITWNGTQYTSGPSPVSPVMRPVLFARFTF